MPVRFLVFALAVIGVSGNVVVLGRSPVQSSLPGPPVIESEILSNGIRISRIHRTGLGDQIEIAFGYRTPITPGLSWEPGEAARLAHRYLALSVPARSVALAAHYAGGKFESVEDPGRIGMRVRVPRANAGPVVQRIARYFSHAILHYEVLEYAREERTASGDSGVAQPGLGTDEKILDVETLLLGTTGREAGPEASGADLPAAQNYVDRFLGTDRAWVVVSGTEPGMDWSPFGSVSFRPSSSPPETGNALSAEQVDMQFGSEPEGGVILATRVPSPHYQSWFGAVVIDELLRSDAPDEARFAFPLSPQETVHLIRTPVRIPDYAEEVLNRWQDKLINLVYQPVPTDRIDAARQRALARLGDPTTIEWFAAHGLASAFVNGWTAIRDLDPDQLRAFASAFYSFRRVGATWAPAFNEPVAVVEDLSLSPEPEAATHEREIRPAPGRLPALGADGDPLPEIAPIELVPLDSGVTLAENETPMVLVGGTFEATLPGGELVASHANGALWSFPGGLPQNIETLLSDVRAERLLVFVPEAGMADARSRFSTWSGGTTDTNRMPFVGQYATVDLPAVVVLEMWLDARLIEAGWWADASIDIDGLEGSRLLIEADPEREAVIREWIAEAGRGEIGETAFLQARRAAIEHFPRLRTDLQIILWQRSRSGTIPSPNDVTRETLQTVVARYF